jgi:N-acetyl-anhydromuramyl-L-alanine amidase AmpD
MMKNKFLVVIATVSLAIALLIGSMKASWAIQKIADFQISRSFGAQIARSLWQPPEGVPIKGCSARPKLYPPKPNIETAFVPGALTLERFRQISPQATLPKTTPSISSPKRRFGQLQNYSNLLQSYQPREEIALAHPTNFGERYIQDVNGEPAYHAPIIVLHETVAAGWQTVRMFQTAHPRDEDQVSYHTLIKLDGSIFYVVPPDKRAFGAGNSVFESVKGIEAVKTNRLYSASVNNFAYHISFESPVDGRGGGSRHSGYTDAQYKSAAWLVARTGVSEDRITTHKAVDRSRTRIDPRSFDFDKFRQLLNVFPKTQEIFIGCSPNTVDTSSQGSF